MNKIAKTQQTLNQIAENNKHIKRNYDDTIEIVLADRFYPSSQICSSCGNRKVDLKLSERIYKCPVCGLEIDRDFNASINLKHYREFPEKSSLWRTKQTKVA